MLGFLGKCHRRKNERRSEGKGPATNTPSYAFSFEQQPDETWRIYIEGQPGYGSRMEDSLSTHRLPDGDRKHVCWTTPLGSLEVAKQVAALWADETQKYILTGTGFKKSE